tara:strand:- start:1981 stop:2634 length:654 start_codon:yes stop_codon:yes gene_type:complete
MLKFKQVHKNYKKKLNVLKNVSFEIERNEMIFLTGHSGAGKTTLLKLLSLEISPSKGEVMFDDKNLNKLSRRAKSLYRQRIGIIHQSPIFLEELSVLENVTLPLKILGVSHKERVYRGEEFLDTVGLLDKITVKPNELSTGQRQRLALARGIITKPKFIIADEPTGNLDAKLSLEIINLFVKINKMDTSVIIATHDLQLLASLPYRILTLHEGFLIN